MPRRHPRAAALSVLLVVAALTLAPLAGRAQPTAPAPTPTAPAAPEPAAPTVPEGSEPGIPLVTDPTPADPTAPLPGSVMRRPEHLSGRPSGFWTSNRPARGGAYRWRIMAMGGLALAITVFFLVRLVRRSGRERAAMIAGGRG